jgi:hypothetical protein
MVRARSTTSESPYLPGLIQFGPYMANGTLGVSLSFLRAPVAIDGPW